MRLIQVKSLPDTTSLCGNTSSVLLVSDSFCDTTTASVLFTSSVPSSGSFLIVTWGEIIDLLMHNFFTTKNILEPNQINTIISMLISLHLASKCYYHFTITVCTKVYKQMYSIHKWANINIYNIFSEKQITLKLSLTFVNFAEGTHDKTFLGAFCCSLFVLLDFFGALNWESDT